MDSRYTKKEAKQASYEGSFPLSNEALPHMASIRLFLMRLIPF